MCASSSFKMITEILKPEQIDNLSEPARNSLSTTKKLFGIMDDFHGD
jgi:hypothetical protein